MEDSFKDQGFEVLGFLSNDFGMQGGTDGQVDMCNDQYGVKFDQFAIDHVSGANPEPVFAWLLQQPEPGPDSPMMPDWNFEKYLISRDGKVVAHWDGPTAPPANKMDNFDANPIVIAIKAELAK